LLFTAQEEFVGVFGWIAVLPRGKGYPKEPGNLHKNHPLPGGLKRH